MWVLWPPPEALSMLVYQKEQGKGRGCLSSHCSWLGLLNPGVWLHPSAPG